MMPADNGHKESPFYIVDSGPASRPRRTLKQGDTFIILDSYGEMGVAPGGPDGLFHADTRYLSGLAVTLDGRHAMHPRALRQLEEKSRLADPHLAGDVHDLPTAAGGSLQPVLEQRQLLTTTYQARAARAFPALRLPEALDSVA